MHQRPDELLLSLWKGHDEISHLPGGSSRRAGLLMEMGSLVAGVEVAMIRSISPAGAAAIFAPHPRGTGLP
jgi:hypothetical protein